MTIELFRLPTQNKALQCYVLMSIWILLLVAGIYKFLETQPRQPEPSVTAELFHSLALDVKTKRIFKICNLPKDITSGNEGLKQSDKWALKGVIIVLRHGDRGPLQHVRNISAVNCGGRPNELLSSYKTFLHNITLSGHGSWLSPGPFHGFPLLPTHPTECQIGQLTMQGVNQLLTLGHEIRKSYEGMWPKFSSLSGSDVLVYSTKYRRTFQSVVAFLFGLVSQEALSKVEVLESQSMNFCFKDCACPMTENLWRSVKKAIAHQLKSHPAVSILSESTGRSVFSPRAEQGALGSDPHAVRDALLTYVCHQSSLPCETPFNCIKRQNVVGVFAYTDWVTHQKWRNTKWKRLCLLRSYGLIRHIVQQMLHMVSRSGPAVIVYSGHDHTLEQLASALGLHSDPLLLRYAARMVFEVYQEAKGAKNEAKDVYFRLLTNGKDVTKQIRFCKNTVSVENRVGLCKIEDIVRFLHDDYFLTLNVTNYKDACVIKNDK